MSLNNSMHVRNIYRTPPDFHELVEKFPEIRPHMVTDLSGKLRFNFQDAAALRQLTAVLLRKDFNLSVHIPANHLVPTLPSRLNYVLWLQDVVATLRLPASETVRGLDIGTGPCAVYSLLCARLGWHMLATDTCVTSLAVARSNVVNNNLQSQIEVVDQSGADSELLSVLNTRPPVHFCMCNPPFFDSSDDHHQLSPATSPGGPSSGRRGHRHRRAPAAAGGDPPAAAAGLPEEVSCSGGERAFVARLIQESAKYRHRCRVFSTLLGHKASVRPVRRLIHETGAAHMAATAHFCQGHTKRWGVAWTYDCTALIHTVPPTKQVKKKRAPMRCVVPHNLARVKYNVCELKQLILHWLRDCLQMTVEEGHCNKYYASYKVSAAANTWTHSRRQRRQQLQQQHQQQQLQQLDCAGAGSAVGCDDGSCATASAAEAAELAACDTGDGAALCHVARDNCDAPPDVTMECESADGAGAGGELSARVPNGKRHRFPPAHPPNSASDSHHHSDDYDAISHDDSDDSDDDDDDDLVRQWKRPRADSSGEMSECDRTDASAVCGGVGGGGDSPPPLLVFTLFVQAVGGDVVLQMRWLAGRLGWDGVNGVLCWLRHQLSQQPVNSQQQVSSQH